MAVHKITDYEQLREFMRMKPTLADTAAFFRCSERTVERTIREQFDQTFVEFREENMVHTRHELVRSAIQQALSGNTALMIFCLKNVCKWKDKFDLEHTAAKPIQLNYALNDDAQEAIEVRDVKEIDSGEKDQSD